MDPDYFDMSPVQYLGSYKISEQSDNEYKFYLTSSGEVYWLHPQLGSMCGVPYTHALLRRLLNNPEFAKNLAYAKLVNP